MTAGAGSRAVEYAYEDDQVSNAAKYVRLDYVTYPVSSHSDYVTP